MVGCGSTLSQERIREVACKEKQHNWESPLESSVSSRRHRIKTCYSPIWKRWICPSLLQTISVWIPWCCFNTNHQPTTTTTLTSEDCHIPFRLTQRFHTYTEDFHWTSCISFLPWDSPRFFLGGGCFACPIGMHVHLQFSSEGVCTMDASACLLCFASHWEADLDPLKCIYLWWN